MLSYKVDYNPNFDYPGKLVKLNNSAKRIVILCSCYYPYIKGGGEISTNKLALGLAKLGHDINIITIANESRVEKVDGLNVIRLQYDNLYWSYENSGYGVFSKILWNLKDSHNKRIADNICKEVKRIQPDLVITSTIEDISTLTWKALKLLGIPVCHITRSYYLLCPYSTMFKGGHNCTTPCTSCSGLSLLKKNYSKYVDHAVGISNFILNKHVDNGYFENAQHHVIHNIASNRDEVRDSTLKAEKYLWSLNENQKLKLGFLGNLLPSKGVESVINSIGSLSINERNSVIFYIGGDGEGTYKEDLKILASDKRVEIVFLGHVNPQNFFNDIDWLVVPSVWSEPFGRVVVEAFFHNTPVLASSEGGIPELMTYDNGVMYSSMEQLTQKLQMILSSTFSLSFSNKEIFSEHRICKQWEQEILNKLPS